MKRLVVLLASASLFACAQETSDNVASEESATGVGLTAISYDGADYGDNQALMLAHGERLSHVLGCRGCHTDNLTGQRFPPEEDFPDTGIYASNITLVMPTMSDAELETLLREGVHPTRTDLWMMPSEIFQFLSDADMKALIAHLRTVEPTGEPTPLPQPTETFMKMIAAGEQNPPSAQMVPVHRDKAPEDLGPQFALGRHVAMTTCAECHAAYLDGYENFTPDLRVVTPMYDDAAFARLLTTGESFNGRDIGLMGLVGDAHFSFLTDHERQAVIDYLQALAEKWASEQQ